MKRFLVLALVAMLILVMLAVPAFAAVHVTGTANKLGIVEVNTMPVPGNYVIRAVDATGARITSDPFDLVYDDTGGLPGLYASIQLYRNGEPMLDGLMIVFSENAPIDIDRPDYLPDICMIVDSNYNPAIYIDNMTLEDPPISSGENMDNVDAFFTGVLGWLQSFGKLFEQPLFLLFAVCVPLIGFGTWGLSKLKNS